MKHLQLPFFTLLTALLAVAGCDGDPGTDGGVPPTDAGADAGEVPMDGGPTPTDAGADAATPLVDAGPHDGGPTGIPADYAFESRFMPGVSSISYGGQTARHVLMLDIKTYVDGLTARIDGGFDPADGAPVMAALEYFFSVPAADRADDPILLRTTPSSLQTTYGELSRSAFLLEKVAGNDRSTDYQDWDTAFRGWSDASIAAHGGGITSPTLFARALMHTIARNAVLRGQGTDRLSPVASPMRLPVHVTESGIDLSQLLQKFLLVSIAFHQGVDDYLDDDVANKGLLTDNTMQAGTNPWTELEHVWDEGFGYFGASRFYGDVTATMFSASIDRDMDMRIDLFTEHNYGASVNAARRDAGARVATDFMGQAWTEFRAGRALITSAGGALSEAQMTELRGHRDRAERAWEGAYAATVIHYINDTLQHMATYGTAAFDHAEFLALATHWAEMKGFAFAFQYNPRSPITAPQFAMIHALLGDAPVLPAAGDAAVAAYRVALRQARGIIGAAFGFDPANLGDDDGQNGW
ncbi:MAG: DUF4856 domain-containing protein [Sandaracinaceae bacterium]|nr:DUF4856 domain-containing protein [Sandaracinaceae bacterium]